jgi:hypothetical protein
VLKSWPFGFYERTLASIGDYFLSLNGECPLLMKSQNPHLVQTMNLKTIVFHYLKAFCHSMMNTFGEVVTIYACIINYDVGFFQTFHCLEVFFPNGFFMIVWTLKPLLEFQIFFTINFGKKIPILDMCKKNLSITLDKLFWTCPLWLGHVFFDQA